MTDKITWDDVIAIGKLVSVLVENTYKPTSKGEPVYAVRKIGDRWPTYYTDPKSAMMEVQLLATRGQREWTMTAEL